MAITNTGSACYSGLGKSGTGSVSTGSGALDNQPYGFNTRFEDAPGTNPEELIAAAHASCFTMALSIALAGAGYKDGELNSIATVSLEKDGEGFKVTRSALALDGSVPGLSEAEFTTMANSAKVNCPISKLLDCDVSLTITAFNS